MNRQTDKELEDAVAAGNLTKVRVLMAQARMAPNPPSPEMLKSVNAIREAGGFGVEAANKLQGTITAAVYKVMPWPFVDVDRDSKEFREMADTIARGAFELLVDQFDDLMATPEDLPE